MEGKNLLDKELELHEIKKGSTLYRKDLDKYKEVRVYDIYLERYIDSWKTIIKVITDSQILYTHFASDLNSRLFIKIPEENK